MPEYPKDLTPVLRDVLSLLSFTTGPIAHVLRDGGGWNIACKCEDEQAVVLHWFIGLALEHGEGWRKIASDHLLTLSPKAEEVRTERQKAYEASRKLAK